MKTKIILCSFVVLGIASCTHKEPSVGEKMLTHSQEAKALSKQWAKGEKNILASKKLEKDGNKLISQGNKRIAKGKELISKGESQVDKGKKKIQLSQNLLSAGQRLEQESESQFVEKYPNAFETQ